MPLGAARFGLSGADLGKLELIETQTVTSGSAVDFTAIKENIYNVHFLTWTWQNGGGSGDTDIRLSNDGGSTFEASNYDEAWQYGYTTGQFAEVRSTSSTEMRVTADVISSGFSGGYVYLYNLGDSAKYSFITFHTFSSLQTSGFGDGMTFGSGVYHQAETIDGIRLTFGGGATINDLKISLYGIKE